MNDSWSCDTLPEEMRAIIDAHYEALLNSCNTLGVGEIDWVNPGGDVLVMPKFQSCLLICFDTGDQNRLVYHLQASYYNNSSVRLAVLERANPWSTLAENEIKSLTVYYNKSFHASSDPNAEHPKSLELKLGYIYEQLSKHNINVEQIKIIPVDNGAFSQKSSVTFVIADGHISAWRVENGGVKRVFIGRV